MTDKIELGAQTSGVDAIERLVSAVDRLEGSLAKLGAGNTALDKMQKQMAAMTKVMKSGFEQLIEMQSDMEARSERQAEIAGIRREAQERARGERALAQIQINRDRQLNADRTFLQAHEAMQDKQLTADVLFDQAQNKLLQGRAAQRALDHDKEQQVESQWLAMLAADREKALAIEIAFDRAVEQAQARRVESAKGAAEKQRLLNTNFLTSPLSGQIATAERATVYSSLGGNATERFGAAAATADIAALRAQHALLPAAVRESGSAISAHNAIMNEGHALARGLAGSLGGLWLTYGSLVPLAAGAALAASLKGVVEQGRQVEYQLKFVEALGGGQVSLDKLLGITDQTVVSVREAAEGMRALAQNGLSASESLKVLPSLLNLSVIGEMSVSQAALAVTGAISAFGLKLEDVDHVANVFALAAATSNTSVIAMTESMKQGSTVASIYGASIEQAAGVMGVLAKNNIIGGAAGTAYTNMLSGLFAPTEKAKKALAELGITTDDGNGHLKDQTVLLDEINRALSRFNDTARTTFMADIWTVRGTKSADAVLKNLDDYKKRVEEARDVTNYMGQAVSVLEDSTTGSFKRLANSVSSSLDRAFASSSPALQALVNDMAHAAKDPGVVATLTNMADAVLRLTRFIYDHITAITVAATAYGALRLAIAVLPAVITETSVAVGVLGLSVKTALGPVGWLIIAIGALVTAYELFIDKTTDVEKSDKRIQNSINNTVEYLDREITALRERNRLRDDPGGAKTIAGGVTEQEASLHGKRAELARLEAQIAAPVSVGGPAASERLQADRRAASPAYQQLQTQILEGEKALNDVREKNHTLQNGRIDEETSKRRSSLLASMDDIVKMGNTHHKGDAGALNPAFLGNQNEALYAKSQEAAKLKDLYERGQITENEAIAKRNAIRDAASAMLSSRAPKEDTKGANDSLKASLEEAQLKLELARMDRQMEANSLTQQNKRGEIGDLQMINAQLAAKLDLNKQAVDVAREQYNLVDSSNKPHKLAALQKYEGAEEKAGKQSTLDTQAAVEGRANVFDRMAQEEKKVEAKTLTDKGEYVKAFLANYEAQYATTIAKVSNDLETTRDADTAASLGSYLLFLTRLQKTGAADALSKELKEKFSASFDGLELKLQQLSDNSGAGSGLSAIFDNALRSEEALAAALPDLVKKQAEMQALANITGDPKDQKSATDELKRIESAGARVRGVWVTVGKDIEKSLTDAFGNPGKALGALLARSLEYATKQKQIDADLAKNSVGAGADKIADLQKKAAKDSASAQISAYGDMASAAKGFFDEQSGGYKILAAAEKAFRIAELAMTFETMAAKLFATTTVTAAKVTATGIEAGAAVATVPVVIGAEAAKSSAYGITALAASLALPFPANLGAFAVVAAMLAAIGVAVAGSGGSGSVPLSQQRQEQNGTGSVLGDSKAKSDSIAKSLALIEKNTYQDLGISNDMLASLKNIEAGIGGLGALVAGSLGQGTAFGKTQDSNTALTGSAASMVGVGATAGAYMGSYFGPVGTVIGAVAGALLGALSRVKVNVNDQGLSIGSGSLGSLAGGVNGSSYSDVNTKKSFLGITYSNKNERLTNSLPTETLQQFTLVVAGMRSGIIAAADAVGVGGNSFIANLDAIAVSIPDISIKGLTGDEIQKALEAAFSKLGDDLAKSAMGGLEQFQKVGEGYLETLMRVAAGYQTVDVVFQSFGKTFGQVGLGSIAARQRLIDLSGGLDQFATQGSFFLKNFFTAGEQAAALKARIDPTLGKYGLTTVGPDASKQFRDFVVALNTTTEAGARTYAELMDIAPAFKAVIDGMKEANSQAADLQDQIDQLTMTKIELLAKDRAALDSANRALFDNLQMQKALADSKTNLADAYDREVTSITAANDRLKTFGDGLRTFVDGLKVGAASPLTPEQKYAATRSQFDLTLAQARGGDVKAQDALQGSATAFLDASKVSNASSGGYTADFNRVTSAVGDMADWADRQVNVGVSSLEQLKLQVGALIDIKAAVQTLPEALQALADARAAAAQTQQAVIAASIRPEVNIGVPDASMQQVVDELRAVKAELEQTRGELAQQTGAQIEAAFASTQAAQQAAAEQAAEIANQRNWREGLWVNVP